MGDQAQVDEKTDDAVHWTNILYPLGNAICFPNSYLLDSDLSSGLYGYPFSEQTGTSENFLSCRKW